jgi:hypothetical protein
MRDPNIYIFTLLLTVTRLAADTCSNFNFPKAYGANDGDTIINCVLISKDETKLSVAGSTSSELFSGQAPLGTAVPFILKLDSDYKTIAQKISHEST